MAATTHQLAIAKASFSAAILRADPVPVSRDEITNFHTILEQTLAICSPTHIQNTKRWILKNVGTSKARANALGKYLAALAPTLMETEVGGKKSSSRRKRVHLLYLVNDVLHHTKFHKPDGGVFSEAIKSALEAMFKSATTSGLKQQARLERLVGIWKSKSYFPESFLDGLLAISPPSSSSDNANKTEEQKTLLLPALHGDPSIPFYDLPAGNLLPHIIPNSTKPINPRNVKPVQFKSITPSATVANAVHGFLAEVAWDTEEPDAVGGFGEGESGRGYYGWSKGFCEQMREKKRVALERERRGREQDASSQRRRSYSYSSELGTSRSRSRSRERRRKSSSPGYEPPPPPPPPHTIPPPLSQHAGFVPPPSQFAWPPPPPPNLSFSPPPPQQFAAQFGLMQQIMWQQQQQQQQPPQPTQDPRKRNWKS